MATFLSPPEEVEQLLPSQEESKRPARTLNVLYLSFLAFVTVCGGMILKKPCAVLSISSCAVVRAGPFGIEAAVYSAGPLITIIALLALAVFWAAPQAVMTAELGTMFDSENGGYVIWVFEALGPYAGFISAFN